MKKRKTVKSADIHSFANSKINLANQPDENIESFLERKGVVTLADAFRLGSRDMASISLMGTEEGSDSVPVKVEK